MIDWSSCSAVERDTERVSGVWVFRGTRVPVSALFENLEEGATASDFVEWFQGVSLDQVRSALEHAARSAAEAAQVRILFDQGTPVPLRVKLVGHQIETAHEMGWSTLQNGRLLDAIEAEGYEVFVKTDKNLPFQQNLSDRSFRVVVLSTTSQPRIRLTVASIQAALLAAPSGVATVVEIR